MISQLKPDSDGAICVCGTRVSLETVISCYQQGDTAEQIHEAFDVLPIDDIYAVIVYYLDNREWCDVYMQLVDRIGELHRETWDSNRYGTNK